jgi:hypothetical protein
MLPWSDGQAAFAGGLTPTMPTPMGLRHASRYAVYRNNVAVALIDALRSRFAVTERLVGTEFFIAAASAFTAAHRPRVPMLFAYGDDFPEFLEAVPGLEDAPFVPDVARLEVLRAQSYHAADAEPLALAKLGEIDPARFEQLTVTLHPSVRRLASDWPVASIWQAHQGEGEPQPPADWSGEAVLVLRPDADVLVHVVPHAALAFIDALAAGEPLAEAAGAALDLDPAFDFGTTLVGLVQLGAIQSIGE